MSEDKFIARVSSKSDLENKLLFTGKNNMVHLGNDIYATAGIGYEIGDDSDDSSDGSGDSPTPPTPPTPPDPPDPPEPPTPSTWGLAFTAEEADSTINIISVNYPEDVPLPRFQYSSDGSTWHEFTIDDSDGIILSNIGDKVYFSAVDTNESLGGESTHGQGCGGGAYYIKFDITGKVAASGDISSLLDKDNSITNLTGRNHAFHGLFSGCESLTTPPELPATTLSSDCYSNMFNGCTSMIIAPELPALTLADQCYDQMFCGCLSIPSIVLPATTLAPRCYRRLFAYALNQEYKLNDITVGFDDWKNTPDTDYTYEWIVGNLYHYSTGTFRCPKALGTNDDMLRTTSGCPFKWTVVNTDV